MDGPGTRIGYSKRLITEIHKTLTLVRVRGRMPPLKQEANQCSQQLRGGCCVEVVWVHIIGGINDG